MTAGQKLDGLKIGLNYISGIDRAYILSDEKFSEYAYDLKKTAENLGASAEVVFVEAYNYRQIVDTIFQIHKKEEDEHRGNSYSVNATGGTKVMAIAACNASIYIGATTYYVKESDDGEENQIDDRVMVLETNKPIKLKNSNKTSIKILHYIEESTLNDEIITSSDIAEHFDMKKQAVTYQIKKLREDRLIIVTEGVSSDDGKTDYRKKGIKLSPQGFTYVRHIVYKQ